MQQTRILVVDDDRLMRTLLVGLLRHEGFHRVVRATGGKEALLKFLQTQPEIVFMDIEMPGISGIETLRAIREFGTVAQVVMVTATATAQNVKQAMEAGAAGFLVKPVSPAKVVAAMQTCFERASKEEGSIELFDVE